MEGLKSPGIDRGMRCDYRFGEEGATIPFPSCSDLIGASHPANWFWIQHGGGPPIKSSGDDPAYSSCSDLFGASITQTGLDTLRRRDPPIKSGDDEGRLRPPVPRHLVPRPSAVGRKFLANSACKHYNSNQYGLQRRGGNRKPSIQKGHPL